MPNETYGEMDPTGSEAEDRETVIQETNPEAETSFPGPDDFGHDLSNVPIVDDSDPGVEIDPWPGELPTPAPQPDYSVTTTTRFAFGHALTKLWSGRRVRRAGWNGKGMYIELQQPDANSKMTLPYIYMKTADDQLVPWLASQTDLLSYDWEVA